MQILRDAERKDNQIIVQYKKNRIGRMSCEQMAMGVKWS